jgi:proline iminopeptidase
LERTRIELSYALNGFFISEGYVYDEAKKSKSIPTVIIHGKYDYICLIYYAEKLADLTSGSKLIIVDAGHSVSENPIKETLIEELNLLK